MELLYSKIEIITRQQEKNKWLLGCHFFLSLTAQAPGDFKLLVRIVVPMDARFVVFVRRSGLCKALVVAHAKELP